MHLRKGSHSSAILRSLYLLFKSLRHGTYMRTIYSYREGTADDRMFKRNCNAPLPDK